MATLADRLDFVLGKKTADKLYEHFGLRTVNDLLRHYPRKYSEGMSVRGEDEALDLEEGEHVTFVDEITETKEGLMRSQPGKRTRKWLRITLGHHRPRSPRRFSTPAGWSTSCRREPGSCCPVRSDSSRAQCN